MANYYMDLSYGSVGKGKAHTQYVLGQGDYKYKDKEVQYVSNNLPSWAENEVDFWTEGDNNENINGMVYKEIKLSLPNDLDLENNIKLLDDFVEQTLGEDHHYTVVIHDKESSYGDCQNIHAHVMFSTRKLDGIERSREAYFKRANRVTKEKGGCKKDETWDGKKRLYTLRKDWEVLQNKYLEMNKVQSRVSCETLEKQREEALKQGDKLKAELLDREPINIDGRILMKRKRTPQEEKELESFKNNREIKSLKESVYNLQLEREEILKVEALESEISKAKEEGKPTLPFSDILDMKSNIEMYNLEIEKNLNSLNDVRSVAIKKIYPELSILTLELENAIEDVRPIAEIEGLEKKIDIEKLKMDNTILDVEVEKIENSLEEKINTLEFEKSKLEYGYETKLNEIDSIELEGYLETQTFETSKKVYARYVSQNRERTKLNDQIKKLKEYSQEKNIEKTALNILTGYKYSKLEKEIDLIMRERGKLATKIESTTERNGLKGDGSEKCNKWIKEYDMLFKKYTKKRNEETKMMDRLNTPQMKNKKIRIEKSIERKLKKQKEDNLFKQFELKASLDILKEKVYLIQDKREPILSNIEQLKNEVQVFERSAKLIEMKLEEKEKMLNNFNYELKAYRLLTNGKTEETIKESNKLVDEIKKLRAKKSKIPDFKFLKKKSITKEIDKRFDQYNKLDEEYKRVQSSISTEDLYDKMLELKEQAIQNNNPEETKKLKEELKGLKNKSYEKKNEIKLNYDLLRETKKIKSKELLKPKQPTFKKFKEDQISSGRSSLRLWSREDENENDGGMEI